VEGVSVGAAASRGAEHGIRTVDTQLVEMGRIYGMSPWTLFRRVILPGALPSIFVGLRYALGVMWLTPVGELSKQRVDEDAQHDDAETVATSSGIGYMALQAREFLLVDGNWRQLDLDVDVVAVRF
jgi:sulfonate transport system permease protein